MHRFIKNIKKSSYIIHINHSKCQSRFLHVSGATGLFSIVLGIGKIVSGILSLSIFVCMNGLYTLGMALARYVALFGFLNKNKKSLFYYRLSGSIMIIASLSYVAYSLWTIWHPKLVYYDKIVAISIATITFTEVGLNLYGVLKNRKDKTLIVHFLKTISLATSLISMVLTQSAILSFADEVYNPSVNGLLGTVMGVIAMLLGLYLLYRIKPIKMKD